MKQSSAAFLRPLAGSTSHPTRLISSYREAGQRRWNFLNQAVDRLDKTVDCLLRPDRGDGT
jgi:hypothetical protein